MLATRVRRCPLASETVTRGMALAWPRTSNLEGILCVGIESDGQRQVPWLGLAEWEGEDRRQREGELISHACRCVKLWVRVIMSDK